MRRLLLPLMLLIAAMLVPLGAAQAITDGELDNNDHPYVALMLAKDANGIPLWRCSGTMVSPTLYLTAGHCTESPAASADIYFSPGPIPLAAGYPADGPNRCAGITGYPCSGDAHGTTYLHPEFDTNAFYTHDLGVVVLDAPVSLPAYGALPSLGQLDSLKPSAHTTFTAVGYGLQKSFPEAAGWKDQATRVRMVAHPHLITIDKGFVKGFGMILSANANTGGTCFGDSGGPNFLGDTNVVAGVTSFGKNGTCAGQGGVYRVDQADDLDWLYGTFGAELN